MSLEQLIELARGKRIVALTGAGISTESGIPDYRSPESLKRARAPMQHGEFVGSARARQIYWARSFRGWPQIAGARPNAGHRALAALERAGQVTGVITQNVDRLHTRAGSRRVVELHGALAEVICLECNQLEPRSAVQDRLAGLNRGAGGASDELRPDGDVEVGDAGSFEVAPCRACGGPLKPNVVFFGGSIPPAWSEAAWDLYAEAELLLVVGSSLAVFSGYRFVRRAGADGVPVAIVNRGETRGDHAARMRLDASAGETLTALARALG